MTGVQRWVQCGQSHGVGSSGTIRRAGLPTSHRCAAQAFRKSKLRFGIPKTVRWRKVSAVVEQERAAWLNNRCPWRTVRGLGVWGQLRRRCCYCFDLTTPKGSCIRDFTPSAATGKCVTFKKGIVGYLPLCFLTHGHVCLSMTHLTHEQSCSAMLPHDILFLKRPKKK